MRPFFAAVLAGDVQAHDGTAQALFAQCAGLPDAEKRWRDVLWVQRRIGRRG